LLNHRIEDKTNHIFLIGIITSIW